MEYSSTAQNKADLFHDEDVKAIIMGSSNPVVQKQTKIKGVDIEQWKSVAPKILNQALLLKFSQNEDLKRNDRNKTTWRSFTQ